MTTSDELTFGRVPYQPIEAGIVAWMKPADAKVYLVIVAHRQTGNPYPSLDTIARLAGITRRAVCKAVKRLVGIGALRVSVGGGRSHLSVYIMADEWGANSEPRFTLSDRETVNTGSRNSEPARPKQGTPVHPKRIEENQKRRAPSKPDSDHTTQQAVAAFVDAYREARGTDPDRPDGRSVGQLKGWIHKNGVTVETFRARVRLAAGLDGKPPWPFTQPGELTLENIVRHWAKLGDALRGSTHGSNTVRPDDTKAALYDAIG